MAKPPRPEFSRPINVGDLRDGENLREISADAEERAALARRFGLGELVDLAARVSLRPQRGGKAARLLATLRARVVQPCVVSLEPVTTDIETEFEVTFEEVSPTARKAAQEIDLDFEDDLAPEPMEGGRIDLGEVVAEQLSLEIPDFPRLPGVEFGGFAVGDGGETVEPERPRPFAALEKLREKR